MTGAGRTRVDRTGVDRTGVDRTGVDATEADVAVGFVVPDPSGNPSGGHTYNDRVLRGWADRGHPSRAVTVGGEWPFPDDAARAAVAAALAAHPVSLIDGLVGACCPHQVQDAVAAGRRVVLLVHLPLADETGLTMDQARDVEGLERWAVHTASAVVATSTTAAEDIRRRHELADVGAVLPGTDDRPVAPGSAGGGSAPRLAVLGSVTRRKNQLGLLDALAAVADRAWTAEFVGPQPDAAYLAAVRDRAAELGLADRIVLPGVLHEEDLERFWARMDLLILPSLHETFGLVVTEALAHGIPAVVSRGTGAVEALSGTPYAGLRHDGAGTQDPPDLAGALIDPGNPPEMASVIGGWLDDPVRRTSWRARALARREDRRDWSAAADELWSYLRPDQTR